MRVPLEVEEAIERKKIAAYVVGRVLDPRMKLAPSNYLLIN